MRSNRLSVGMTVAVAVLCSAVFVTPTYAAGPQEKVLHNFNNNGKDGIGPVSALIFDNAGNLYGTTQYGGTGICTFNTTTPGCGTVFELSPKQGGGWVETILHNFVDDGVDGTAPQAGLILDAAGNLYGITTYGGSGNSFSCAYNPGCGTVFELSPVAGGGWTEKILHNFTQDGVDGIIPETSLIFDAAGNLYGVTDDGGANFYYGTVFELSPHAGGEWTETILHSFNNNGADGYYPQGVILDASGNLYGTTYNGGANTEGTVFELTPAAGGGWTETILNSFGKTGFDGYNPYAGLIFDAAGNLYGTTNYGGGGRTNSGGGTIFKLTPAIGGGWTETILHSFEHSATSGDFLRGALIFDASGNLYSTTELGGHSTLCSGGCGTVFKLSPGADGIWTETLLNSFARGKDGQYPTAGVIFDAAGNLYGTTSAGGLYGDGTVFEITP